MALSYLRENGLKLLQRNYRSKRGEIDLIMQDRDITVFIEVRYRKKNSVVDVIETIDHRKCSNIISTSEHYLQRNRRSNRDICRFDIVLLTGPSESANIEWIKNAFEA